MLSSAHATITFDDFNVDEGHFAAVPTFSGSTVGILTASTADRVTVAPLEGAGCEQLVAITNGSGSAVRVRFLSGTGSAANNIAFTTSSGTDGWIGFYCKTTNTDWNVQLWIEGASNNGGVPKDIIPDGEWHLYEWDLDNTVGDADGWGTISGIIAGVPTVADGSHTIDSIIFRNSVIADKTNVLFLDFVAKSDGGSISNLLAEPCLSTSGVGLAGPISTNSNEVTVTGVNAAATAVTVYQNSGPSGSMVAIGTKTTGITAGDNVVTVSGLVKAAQVVATQTVSGQESCVPADTSGLAVGGGANPSVRMALSIRETSSTGPVGDPGITTSGNIHFLGANVVSGGAPINGKIIYPSNAWQTVTFSRGTLESVGDPANAVGTTVDGGGYAANDFVSIQVYAYRTLTNSGTRVYSETPSVSSDITSNDVFNASWSWDPVSGADGYRVIRSTNFAGFFYEHKDVTTVGFNDDGTGWVDDVTVTPTIARSEPSIQWNPTVSNPNNIPGTWGILESLNFAIYAADTGPFDLYIDSFQNGATVFQDFELAPAKTTDYGFRQPSFSGTTSASLLTTPNVGQVSNEAADGGTKSFHIQFQFSGTNVTKWLRLTTSGVNNPQVNLDDPISFRMLLLPVNGSLPPAPAAPSVSANAVDGKTVLNWTGGHRVQTSVNVTGPYTNAPQPVLDPNTWTNVTLGGFLGPWTNSYTEPTRFFRLVD